MAYLTSADQVTLAEIPDGSAGVMATLRIMRDMAREARRDYAIRRLAEEIIRDANVDEKDWANEARAIHNYVRDNIRYTFDINGIETVKTPQKLLESRIGDCDDKSLLTAALLESIGHPARFVAVGFEPGQLSHVFVETRIGNRWFASDTTEPVDFGWTPPRVENRAVPVHI